MKPILKIETPSSFPESEFKSMNDSLKDSDVAKEYHILVVVGTTEYFNFEIITASDIRLHQSSMPSVVDWKDIAHNHGKLV